MIERNKPTPIPIVDLSALPGWFIIVETGKLTWNHPRCVLEKLYNLRPNWKLVPEPLQPPFLIRCLRETELSAQ